MELWHVAFFYLLLPFFCSEGRRARSSSCDPSEMHCNPYECNFVLEMMHIQDLSESFHDDLIILEQQLVELLEMVQDSFPNSKFGIATFTDKPLEPFGFPYQGYWFEGDWCLNVTTSISSSTPEEAVEELLRSEVGSGNDFAENQLGALHDIARNASISGWSTDQFDEHGLPVVRVVSLSTDAIYHIAGEGANSSWELRTNDGDGWTVCDQEDYPKISQVREALLSRDIYTIFLVGNETGEDVQAVYIELLDALGTPGSVHSLNANSSDIVEVMEEAFETMAEKICSKATIDLVLAQDTTSSYRNDLPHLHEQLANYTENVHKDYVCPYFGLTSFGDKPLEPLGHKKSGDYCYAIHQNLTVDREDLLSAAATLTTKSGRDWKESQLDAIISSVSDPLVGWRQGTTWNGFDLLRIVALATDSGFHVAGDAAAQGHVLSPHQGGIVNCTGEEYPTVEQLAAPLLANGVSPLFISTSDIVSIYQKLVAELELLGVTGEVVELKDFGELGDAVVAGVRRLDSKIRWHHTY